MPARLPHTLSSSVKITTENMSVAVRSCPFHSLLVRAEPPQESPKLANFGAGFSAYTLALGGPEPMLEVAIPRTWRSARSFRSAVHPTSRPPAYSCLPARRVLVGRAHSHCGASGGAIVVALLSSSARNTSACFRKSFSTFPRAWRTAVIRGRNSGSSSGKSA